jgi:aryl-alcohol dehydrogenase-like predicted oxidoreductase
MQKRKLGKSGLEIAPLMFGGNVFGWTIDEATSFKILDAFVGAGFDAIDTADVYSKWVPGNKGGESEIIIGKWMKARGNRSKLIIASKVGMEMPGLGQGLSKAYIMARVEDSLKRLQTDYIDLYQSHVDDKATPFEETFATYETLIKQGKIRAIGASNTDAPRLAEALKVSAAKQLPRYDTLQPLYNLSDRADFEKEAQPLCVKEDVAVIPFFALASGFLTGKYRTEKYLNDRGLRILKALDDVSARLNAKPAQVALAWLAARPAIAAPIASATNLQQLDDLVASTRLRLDADATKALDAASA